MPHMTIQRRNSTGRGDIFWRRTDDLLDETAKKYCTDRQIQWKQLVATAPTQKLIDTLPAVSHLMIWHGN